MDFENVILSSTSLDLAANTSAVDFIIGLMTERRENWVYNKFNFFTLVVVVFSRLIDDDIQHGHEYRADRDEVEDKCNFHKITTTEREISFKLFEVFLQGVADRDDDDREPRKFFDQQSNFIFAAAVESHLIYENDI